MIKDGINGFCMALAFTIWRLETGRRKKRRPAIFCVRYDCRSVNGGKGNQSLSGTIPRPDGPYESGNDDRFPVCGWDGTYDSGSAAESNEYGKFSYRLSDCGCRAGIWHEEAKGMTANRLLCAAQAGLTPRCFGTAHCQSVHFIITERGATRKILKKRKK